MAKVRTVWVVGHPEHADAWVKAENWEQATVEAAKFWGVPWATVAALCEEKRKFQGLQNVCSHCGTYYFGELPLCDKCKAQMETEETMTHQRLGKTWYLGKKRA